MAQSDFNFLADSLEGFVCVFDEVPMEDHNSFFIEQSIKEVQKIWEEVQVAYRCSVQDINNAVSETQTGNLLYSLKKRYQECTRIFMDFTRKIGMTNQNNAMRFGSFAHSTLGEVNQNIEPCVKLPPCDIEPFSGDHASWPGFRDMFTAIYRSNARMTGVQRLYYLLNKTRGEANKIVRRFPLSNEGFCLAWDSLSNTYENKRALINVYLQKMFSFEKLTSETSQGLKNLQSEFADCLSCIKVLGIKVEEWDAIIVYLCSTKLPAASIAHWEEKIADSNDIPKWEDLNKFLTHRHRAMSGHATYDLTKRQTVRPGNRYSENKFNSHQVSVQLSDHCKLCFKPRHSLSKCQKFHELSVQTRIASVKRMGLCWNCLEPSHMVKDCPSKYSCLECNKKHHTLLHNSTTVDVPRMLPESVDESDLPSTSQVQSHFVSNRRNVLLGTAIVTINVSGTCFTARALIDSGSEVTFMTERLLKRLKLPSSKAAAQVTGLNNTITGNIEKTCSIVLKSNQLPSWKLTTNVFVLPKITGCLPSQNVELSMDSLPRNMVLADPLFYKSDQVDLLIGGDIYPSVVLGGLKKNILGSLLAQETVFGWVLTGPIQVRDTRSATFQTFFNGVSLDKQLQRFWEVEEVPQYKPNSDEDKYCEDLFKSTTIRTPSGRYMVSLPFRKEFIENKELGQSRSRAISLFLRSEKSLLRNSAFKEEYDKVLKEYVSLGHATLINPPLIEDPGSYYYLPHHAVIKPDSSTTKVRVVFNASFPTDNGQSLNDILYQGPTLQKDLMMLVLKWRFYKYVFNGDIEKMYRQILVAPKDANYQRIVFRSEPKSKLVDYKLKTVTFGVNCAPYLAIRTLLRLADDVKEEFPLASEVLKDCMYVDDALVGAHTIDIALKTRQELEKALASAGFIIRKWTSNNKDILAGISRNDLLNEAFLELAESSNAKTLGIRWNAQHDSFFFVSQCFDKNVASTKRGILSVIAKLFDPAGWLGPTIIIAKMLMQELWLKGIDWDEEVSENIRSRWENFLEGLGDLDRIQIPRWIRFSPDAKVEFHGFCDASEKAYAATLYIRVSSGTERKTTLIASKTKVAPVKSISLPRLELCGAVLLADLVSKLVPEFPVVSYELYLWTDSTIVLSWLKKPPCTWTVFVANRVSKIIEKVGEKWFHVRSEDNPADLGSRGMMPAELSTRNLWWHGPSWLQLEKSEWPIGINSDEMTTDLELKKIHCNFNFISNFEDVLERFSSYDRALRVLAYVFRFANRCSKKKQEYFSTTISVDEIKNVENCLIIVTQKVNFAEEYHALIENRPLPKKSTILSLSPFLDEQRVIRVGGRLSKCPTLSYNEKYPIILPYNCHFSQLIVQFAHKTSLHGGNSLLLRLLRMRFWILKAKNLIRKTIRNCKECLLYKKQSQSQIMGTLPTSRVTLSRPFSTTGVDFAGPLDIKFIRGKSCHMIKGYVCLFVCFATKAIHLEAVSDLSAHAFLACFNRFLARRGCPAHIYSDNGTNFKAAAKDLEIDFNLVFQSVKSDFIHKGFQQVEWHFIPPGAPHMGGLWEAGVKCFKSHFKKVVGSMSFTFEELGTLLSRIEACLNSRPLTPISNDPDELLCLTPGHFLIGAPLLSPPQRDIPDEAISYISRWQKVTLLYQQFCRRWKTEYLNELHKRVKWKHSEEDVKVDDMVVIKEENLAPNEWRMGRVVRVFRGNDNRVRVVEVRTQRGLITRPIHKLVRLPVA